MLKRKVLVVPVMHCIRTVEKVNDRGLSLGSDPRLAYFRLESFYPVVIYFIFTCATNVVHKVLKMFWHIRTIGSSFVHL